jgi:hypothetical protein
LVYPITNPASPIQSAVTGVRPAAGFSKARVLRLSLQDVMSVKSIVLSLALAYAVWALFINARGAYELFVGRPYADRQRAEYYRHRLSGTPLE